MALELNGSSVLLGFDEERALLTGFKSLLTGWKFLDKCEGLSFELAVPKAEFPGNTVRGTNNQPKRVARFPDRIEILWDHLTDECGESLDIDFCACVWITQKGCKFTATLTNKSPYIIEHVAYPCFGKVERPQGAQELDMMVSAYSGMWKTPLYPTFQTMSGYWSSLYPLKYNGSPESPYMLVCTDDEGMYFGRHDPLPDYRMAYFSYLVPEVRDSHTFSYAGVLDPTGEKPYITLSAYHFVFLSQNSEKKLSDVVIEPYTGSWQVGLSHFTAWSEAVLPKAHIPEWTKEIHSWYQLQMSSYGYGVRYKYRDLPQIGRELVSKGVKAIQITGWTKGGMDGELPCHDTDPRMGTFEEFKQAIATLEEMGIRTVLYCKFVFADMRTQSFASEYVKYASRDIYGLVHSFGGYPYDRPAMISGMNSHRLAIMCMNDGRWRKACLEQVRTIISLGASGLLFDETFSHCACECCFDRSHGHAVPAYSFIGDIKLAEEMRKLCVDMGKEDFLLAGEALPALYRPYYALSYFRFMGNDMPDYRLTDQEYPMLCTAKALEDRSPINFCLMYRCLISYEPHHFKGRIGDFPKLLDYGSKVDDLRKKYVDRIWNVQLIPDNELVPKQGGILSSVMLSKKNGLRTLVLVNVLETEQEVCCPKTVTWELVTPEDCVPRKSAERIVIPPLSAVILLEVGTDTLGYD